MQVLQSMSVWLNTTGTSYNAMRRAGYAAFLGEADKRRLERIRQARMLFDGQHREYFLVEQRTQFNFPHMQAIEGPIRPYITLNLLKLICLKTADLLFGSEPLIRADDQIQQNQLDALIDRSSLHTLFYNTCVECCYEGEAFLEAIAKDGQVYLARVPADEIFPVGARLPDGQYAKYVRYALRNAGTQEAPIWLLLETWYLAGAIERKLFQLDSDGKKKPEELSLDQWPLGEGESPLTPRLPTGLDRNTITYIVGETLRDQPLSRMDGLVQLQDELNAKQTQIARVLAKHADPKLAMPVPNAGQGGSVPASHDLFYFRDKEQIPTYIVWNAEIEAAYKDRSFTLNAMLIVAEMSPALLGLKEGAAPDAARKLRLEATNTLAMVQRIGANWKKGIRRAIAVAQDLENTLPGSRYSRGPIGVEMRDGIPVDEVDEANVIATLVGANAMSERRAVERQLTDPAAVEKELAELKKKREAATPSILMGREPGGEDGMGEGTNQEQV